MSVPSVPGWLPDSSAITNSAFSSPDPSGLHSFDSSSPGILSQPALDPNQFHHQQRAQLQNGGSRTSSPGFQTPAYHVNSVVPLKRPRPHEDSMSISPRPHPQGLPTSRSQTPLAHNQQQLAYQIYQNNQQQPPQRQYTPMGYNSSHLQHVGSANASPSPVMQNQPFNPQGNAGGPPTKRLSTQSPSPFSPAPTQQGFMPQGSPPPNHTPRVGTPQSNGNMGVAPPPHPPYSQGFTQGFSSPAATASASPTPVSQSMGQNPNMHAQLVYQMRQQQAQQQQQRYMQQNQQQQQGMGMQPGPPNSMSMPSSQMNQGPMGPNQMNPNQMQRPNSQGPAMPGGRLSDPNQFMKSLYDYMQKRGTPIQGYPYIGSKPVSLVNLYGTVLKLGGSQRVAMENRWQQVAMSLGFSPDQYPGSAEELARIFRNNLAPYEDAWMRSQREAQQKRAMQQAGARPGQMDQLGQPQPSPTGLRQGGQMVPGGMHPQQQTSQRNMGVPKLPGPSPQDPNRSGMTNGYTPQRQSISGLPQTPSTPNRASIESTPPQGHSAPPGYPKPGAPPSDSAFSVGSQTPATPKKETPTDFKPSVRTLDTYGGLNLTATGQMAYELSQNRPTVPTFHELGLIDIHALTMMLKSGLTGEVRVALDTLATVSVEPRLSIALESCEDLVEALIDVAEAQVELLGEHAQEDAESISLPSYEEVVRECRSERDTLLNVAHFGDLEHELERAADRLICTTTVLRNLSFFESNHNALADKNVVRFLSSVIERLGTSPTFLRTYTNLLDFMKDMIVYLSNLSHAIVLPSEDEALNLLHLILAFAPQPGPAAYNRENIMFTPYSPAIHRYLPPAVDSLAKLLARDEPNRAYYRTIFLSESTTTPPYDLLTRSFALAISPIPDNSKTMLPQAVELRKPFLEQGMLAADILAGIVPAIDQGVARSWLSSEDGFALSLLRLVCLLSPQQKQIQRQPGKMISQDDLQPFARITHRGMSILRKLAEKADDPANETAKLPLGMLPKKESLLGALLTVHIDGVIVKELCNYAGLDD